MSINSKLEAHAASLTAGGKTVAHRATISRIVENLLRLGYVVRGMVYGMIGVLALQVAIGGGTLTDTQGAIAAIGRTAPRRSLVVRCPGRPRADLSGHSA
jgi:hypothetical protein